MNENKSKTTLLLKNLENHQIEKIEKIMKTLYSRPAFQFTSNSSFECLISMTEYIIFSIVYCQYNVGYNVSIIIFSYIRRVRYCTIKKAKLNRESEEKMESCHHKLD